MCAHSLYFKRSQTLELEPTEQQKELILFVAEQAYETCKIDTTSWSSRENFNKVIRSLDFQSSPGVPYNTQAPTIGRWLGFTGFSFDEDRVQQLWMEVQQLMLGDLDDVLWRCFIKPEPHKKTKASSNRWRLIMGPPLCLQVLWQMVFAKQNEAEIVQALNIPSQQGISVPYGGWKLFYNQWYKQELSTGTDFSAWDWTIPPWALELDLSFRWRQTSQRDLSWKAMASKLYENAFRTCKLVLGDGTILIQQLYGIMKSGCVNTISTNGHCNFFLHVYYCLLSDTPITPFPKCVGDDKLVNKIHANPDHFHLWEKIGVIIKSVSHNYEFIGRTWSSEGPKPCYLGKHVFNLQYSKEEFLEETLESYLCLYVNCPTEYTFFLEVAKRLGFTSFKSRDYYKTWMDNPCAQLIARMM